MAYYVLKYRKDARYSWSTSTAVFTSKVKAKSAVANNPALKSYQKSIIKVSKIPKKIASRAKINMR